MWQSIEISNLYLINIMWKLVHILTGFLLNILLLFHIQGNQFGPKHLTLVIITIIIMVIYKCYFSREHIALSHKKNGENIELGKNNRLKAMGMQMKMKMSDSYVQFLRISHSTEHPSRGCSHLVLISQLGRLMQCG